MLTKLRLVPKPISEDSERSKNGQRPSLNFELARYMTKITVLGGSGRMGRAISEVAQTFAGVEIVARVGRTDDAKRAIAACDVVVDFSNAGFSIGGIALLRR